jgi:outer membrane protein assembly factor BamB
MTSEPATRRRWRLPALAGLVLIVLVVAVALALKGERSGAVGPAVVWTFEQPQRGAIIAAPTVTADGVCVAAIRDNALAPSGVVYCLDRRDGAVRWTFDDDGKMLHTISTPCLGDGRLYVGEGMHGNDVCKLYCLDAATGRKLWEFTTGGHIESSPCIADDAVFFGAGDDGIYCLDAVTGVKRWQFTGRWHIDSSPFVMNGRLYAGSGISRLHKTTEIFCLDAATGRPLWRTPTELPVWGSPVLHGGQVFFGTGTGRLTQSAEPPEKPAGVLLCADAATGDLMWTARIDDAIFGRPAVDAERVFFGARDGHCYCLDRRDGRHLWQTDMGSAVVTRPVRIDGRVYIVASGGRVSCLDANNGQALWTFDVADHTQTRPQLLSSPVILREGEEKRRQRFVYFGTELRNGAHSAAVLYCLRD